MPINDDLFMTMYSITFQLSQNYINQHPAAKKYYDHFLVKYAGSVMNVFEDKEVRIPISHNNRDALHHASLLCDVIQKIFP